MDGISKAFQNHEIRAANIDGEPWVVAQDVADALGYDHTPNFVRMISDSYKDVQKVNTLAHNQQVTCLKEPGLYEGILKARQTEDKPYVREFQDWVYEDLLPEVRRTGSYSGDGAPARQAQSSGRRRSQTTQPAKTDQMAEMQESIQEFATLATNAHKDMKKMLKTTQSQMQDVQQTAEHAEKKAEQVTKQLQNRKIASQTTHRGWQSMRDEINRLVRSYSAEYGGRYSRHYNELYDDVADQTGFDPRVEYDSRPYIQSLSYDEMAAVLSSARDLFTFPDDA
jgi:prophage antirepressor-like protein